jgi:Bacterial aa3 type cytochrome c oxidase subunit IV
MSVDTSQGNKNMDYSAHAQSYNLFVSLIKYGTIGVVVILTLMAMFLV